MRLLALLAGLLIATPAQADHWTVERMNAVIDQTNMIVGNHCSGTLISLEHRLILTNHHCITQYVSQRTHEKVVNGEVKKVLREELRDVTVSQKSYADFREVGKSEWKATIIARWKESDLALLQFRAEKIPHSLQSNVYSGDKVMRGEKVWAVGNPRLLDASLTTGIVSSVNRLFRVPWANGAEVAFIQMDAGIAGGSSGGALYNEHGFLIGVPAAAFPGSALGLAIPFPRIQKFLTDNCYEEVWNSNKDVKSHKACTEEKEAKAKEKDKKEASLNGAYFASSISTADFKMRWSAGIKPYDY